MELPKKDVLVESRTKYGGKMSYNVNGVVAECPVHVLVRDRAACLSLR